MEKLKYKKCSECHKSFWGFSIDTDCQKCKKIVSMLDKDYYTHAYKYLKPKRIVKTNEEKEKMKGCRLIVQGYVKFGKIKKLSCNICGDIKSQAHHTDYNKPLKIKWLCKKHHIIADNKRRKKEYFDYLTKLKQSGKC